MPGGVQSSNSPNDGSIRFILINGGISTIFGTLKQKDEHPDCLERRPIKADRRYIGKMYASSTESLVLR
jgi:hypothetical protein